MVVKYKERGENNVVATLTNRGLQTAHDQCCQTAPALKRSGLGSPSHLQDFPNLTICNSNLFGAAKLMALKPSYFDASTMEMMNAYVAVSRSSISWKHAHVYVVGAAFKVEFTVLRLIAGSSAQVYFVSRLYLFNERRQRLRFQRNH
jgi:hypothetical protein